jgi:hypothetical protein
MIACHILVDNQLIEWPLDTLASLMAFPDNVYVLPLSFLTLFLLCSFLSNLRFEPQNAGEGGMLLSLLILTRFSFCCMICGFDIAVLTDASISIGDVSVSSVK